MCLKIFIVNDDDSLQRVPQAKFERLRRGDTEESLPQYMLANVSDTPWLFWIFIHLMGVMMKALLTILVALLWSVPVIIQAQVRAVYGPFPL